MHRPRSTVSPIDYLVAERQAESKSEFFDGEVLAMSGVSRRHGLIAVNALATLHAQLRDGDCRIVGSGLKVRAEASNAFFYPDLVVYCGEPQLLDDAHDTLINPTLVVEVLSPSTERYDRGAKSAAYRRIPSLSQLLLLAQDEPAAELLTRGEGDSWVLTEARGEDGEIELGAIGARLPLAAVYADLPPPPPETDAESESSAS